jgi:hemerythrin-like metal-binding protein
MATSSWGDEYEVNVMQIDVQHRMLLKLIDNIHDCVEARVDKIVLKDLLDELAEFTRMHFLSEEQLMKAHGFPDLIEHHEEHRALLQHLNELVMKVSNGKFPTFYSDYDISSDWALVHISDQDNTLGTFLNSKGII